MYRIAGLAGVAAIALAAATPSGADSQRCGLDAEGVWQKTEQSVVQVFALSINPYRVDDRVLPTFGSGFVIPGGFVLTNYHVVEDAKFIEVYEGRRSWSAGLVGSDIDFDIALLRLWDEGQGQLGAPLTLAPPSSVGTGQKVFAIGFPFGLGKTITQGIVTGTGRVMHDTTQSWLEPFLQTDAAVNVGNSGGPLLDDCGRVLGIISQHAQPAKGEDLGFAIPTQVLTTALPDLARKGHIIRPWHGLYGQMLNPLMGYILDVPYDLKGFLVETVEPGSAADRAGIRGGDLPIQWAGLSFILGGDIITEVNGREIDSMSTAVDIVRHMKVGQQMTITYVRDREEREATVVLEERPQPPYTLNR